MLGINSGFMSNRHSTSDVAWRPASSSGQSALCTQTVAVAGGEVWATSYVTPAVTWKLHRFIRAWRLRSTFSSETLARALQDCLFTLLVSKNLQNQNLMVSISGSLPPYTSRQFLCTITKDFFSANRITSCARF
jgi:hypothetical protein